MPKLQSRPLTDIERAGWNANVDIHLKDGSITKAEAQKLKAEIKAMPSK